MNPKLLVSLIAVAGTVALLLSTGVLMLSPYPAEAIPICGEGPAECLCPSGGERQTGMVWGMGPTCGEAFQDAINQTRSMMNCADGVCSETFVVTTGCWDNGTEIQVDGYSLFKCYVCWGGEC